MTVLRCVLYVSTARADLGLAEVRAIVEESQRNNVADGITGLLLFSGSNFLQLIEGGEEPLGRLMRRLFDDQRHSGLVRLSDRAIVRRACDGWSMQPVGIGLERPRRGAMVEAALPADLDDDVRQMIVNFARLN